ncbi:MAG TPA: alpha/beta family hydrolase [Actinocrinis sp.]|nr:alpha/beta family hydrolase [Actinocrinis sp.]
MTTLVQTPVGDARLTCVSVLGPHRATLVLGHGAGGGIEAADLQALAAALPAHGVEVVLVEQPWRVAGKRIAPAPKTLDVAWRAVLEHLRERRDAPVASPLIVGGRSAGARVACRTGASTGAAAVLALAFPLHPPGKPEKTRADELTATGLRTLIIQGATDPFGSGAEFPPLPDTHRLVALPAGNHEFVVRKDQSPVLDAIVDTTVAWINTLF